MWQSSEGHHQRKWTSLEVVVMFNYFSSDFHHLATDIPVLFYSVVFELCVMEKG